MNRRGFFGFLGGAAVAASLLPEILLEDSKTIFLPPVGGWAVLPGNRLLTMSMISREAMVILSENMAFVHTMNRSYDPLFAQAGTGSVVIASV